MRVNLEKIQAQALQTSFFYGVFRTGKTFLCCTFPRVAWFGTAREGGYKTIGYMPREAFYEPNYPPLAFLIASPAEFLAHLEKDVEPLIKTGQIQTVVIELSVYSDELIAARAHEKTWDKYTDLAQHILAVDMRLKKLGVHVVYNSLAVTEDDNAKPSSVMIAGRILPRKMPALMDCVGYLQADGPDRILHLIPFGNFPAGHRYNNRLPAMVRNPSYRILEGLLAGDLIADEQGNVSVNENNPRPKISLPSLKKP